MAAEGCWRLWELSGTYAGAVDIIQCSRRRERLVVRAIVDRHQVCEAGVNAERADPVLASSNTLASTKIPGAQSLYVCVCARVGLLQDRTDPAALPSIESRSRIEAPGTPPSLKTRRRETQAPRPISTRYAIDATRNINKKTIG